MIKSLNGNCFDTIFFVEEEFEKPAYEIPIVSTYKESIKSVIETFVPWINIKTFDDNYSIRFSKIEDPWSKNTLANVYFVDELNPDYPESKIAIDNGFNTPIMYVPSTSAPRGSYIFFVSLYKYFFKKDLKLLYDKDMKLILNNVRGAISMTRTIHCLAEFLRRFNPQLCPVGNPTYYKIEPLDPYVIMKMNLKYGFDKYFDLTLQEILTITSIRRYLRDVVNTIVDPKEFDENIIKPFISTYMRCDSNMQYFNTELVKAATNIFMQISDVLESPYFRNSNEIERWCILKKCLRKLEEDDSYYDKDQKLEAILIGEQNKTNKLHKIS